MGVVFGGKKWAWLGHCAGGLFRLGVRLGRGEKSVIAYVEGKYPL